MDASTTTSSPAIVRPIAPLIERICEEFHPRQIWLFGSRARGDNRNDSDWDLLTVVDDDAPDAWFDPEVLWRRLGLDGFRADVVMLSAKEFSEDADTPNTLAWPVAREGRLVYER
jgi:predicted nucleotidyltransferase